MAEYIEREAVLAKAQEVYHWCGHENRYGDFIPANAVLGIPTADVAPVAHGEWMQRVIERSDSDGDWLAVEYHCSLCGRIEYRKEPYCNCGAKMDGERKGDDE